MVWNLPDLFVYSHTHTHFQSHLLHLNATGTSERGYRLERSACMIPLEASQPFHSCSSPFPPGGLPHIPPQAFLPFRCRKWGVRGVSGFSSEISMGAPGGAVWPDQVASRSGRGLFLPHLTLQAQKDMPLLFTFFAFFLDLSRSSSLPSILLR